MSLKRRGSAAESSAGGVSPDEKAAKVRTKRNEERRERKREERREI
jgi:hypothetical protein